MKLTFLGAAREVTGSCTLIEAGGHRFLVDCGMEQGKDVYPNADLPCAPGEIEAILLTHAHIDHSGRIPSLYQNGFRGWRIPPTFRSRKPSGKTAKPSAAAMSW